MQMYEVLEAKMPLGTNFDGKINKSIKRPFSIRGNYYRSGNKKQDVDTLHRKSLMLGLACQPIRTRDWHLLTNQRPGNHPRPLQCT